VQQFDPHPAFKLLARDVALSNFSPMDRTRPGAFIVHDGVPHVISKLTALVGIVGIGSDPMP
jgi:hypothetical protein